MSDLFADLEALKIICPCCLKEKKVKETPLLNIFFALHSTNREKILESDYLKGQLQRYFDFKARAKDLDKSQIIYHTLLWACQDCINQGKALIADFSRQKAYGMGGPISMYVNLEYNCRNCNQLFSFKATEQKHWYEELGFIIDSRPINCPSCRKEIRQIKNAHQKLMQLLNQEGKLSQKDLEEIATCYTIIGAQEKADEFRRRIKNLNMK